MKFLKPTWQPKWVEIGNKRFYARSSWEVKYAKLLEKKRQEGVILEWEHEPETFWFEAIKRGVRSYLPDFRVTFPDSSIEYHEVKGYFDSKSKTKIKRMAKYHPFVKLRVIDAKTFNKCMLLNKIPNEFKSEKCTD